MTALLLKIIPAIMVFILTMGIIDTKSLQGHPFFKGIIALLTAISTLLLSDQLYSLATGEPSTINEIMKDVRSEDKVQSNVEKQDVSTKPVNQKPVVSKSLGMWNPKIFRGERSYAKQGHNKVKDNYTNLIWQSKGSNGRFTHAEATAYCKRQNMRLPSIEELYYLADVTQEKAPKIDKNYFDIQSSWYWSSTLRRDDSNSAWVVDFDDGGDNWYKHTHTYYVLCVSGQ